MDLEQPQIFIFVRKNCSCRKIPATDPKLHSLPYINIPLLNQSATHHNDEKLPLGVTSVLTFSNPQSADVDGNI